MTKERLPENESAVKNKKRTRRVVPPGVPRKLKNFPKLSKRAKAGREAPGYLFKVDFIDWLAGYPGMTHAFWKVARVIVSHYKFKLGKAWPSIQYIAEMANASTPTVKRAVSFFHEQGIIFTQSGGLGGRGLKRSSHYVPQFRLILNDTTGAINTAAPYLTAAENWAVAGVNFPVNARGCAELVAQNDLPKAVAQNDLPESPPNPQKDGELVAQNDPLWSDSVVGRSASANADALSGASASEEKQAGILPPDSENVKIKYEQVKGLAAYFKLDPRVIIEIFANRVEQASFVIPWFENKSLDTRLPDSDTPFAHLIIQGDREPVIGTKGKAGDIALNDLGPEDWLAVEYRIADNSPAV